MPDINAVFDRLDQWKRLPSYQLERRADIFFSLYLPEVLGNALGTPINKTIVPEFPVKQNRTNRSDKVDYLAVTADARTLVYVELKTDDRSLRKTQFEYLIRAASRPPRQVLAELEQIGKATRQKIKYAALRSALDPMGLADTHAERYPEASQVVLVQPKDHVKPWVTQMFADAKIPFSVIGFHRFAETVSGHGDPVSKRFAKSLDLWAGSKAGSGRMK